MPQVAALTEMYQNLCVFTHTHADKGWTERFQRLHVVFVKKSKESRLNAARHDNTELMSQSCLTCFVSCEPLSVGTQFECHMADSASNHAKCCMERQLLDANMNVFY